MLKRFPVGRDQLRRKDGFSGFFRLGVFQPHDIVSRFHDVGRHRQRKQAAPLHGVGDGFVKIFTRYQKLVVPDGDVPAELIFVDQPHEILGVPAVFFPVAQKYIGVKGRPHFPGQFISHQHRSQKFRQLFRVGQRGGIGVLFVEHLQVAAYAVEVSLQPLLLHQGQDRDVAFHGERKLHVPRPVGLIEKPGGHGDDEELHLFQLLQKRFLIAGSVGFLVIVDGAVLYVQNICKNILRTGGQIRRMSGKEDSRFPLRSGISPGAAGKFHRVVPPVFCFFHYNMYWGRMKKEFDRYGFAMV